MAVNRFVLNGISYHGHGAINEIPGIVASKGFKKAFVASDPDLVKFGVTAKVTDLLKANGIDFELYTDIKPNPTIENVQNGVAAFQASGADFMYHDLYEKLPAYGLKKIEKDKVFLKPYLLKK